MIHHERDQLLKYVRSLADRETNAIGFLPDTVYAPALETGRLHVVRENGQPCGFILHGPERPNVRIYQTAVDPQARLNNHGRELWLDTLLASISQHVERITWICATDLPSNGFWQRMSSQPKRQTKARTLTRRDLFHYEHILPTGEELERYLDEHLRSSALWKIAKLQGLEDRLIKIHTLRFRRTKHPQ